MPAVAAISPLRPLASYTLRHAISHTPGYHTHTEHWYYAITIIIFIDVAIGHYAMPLHSW